ncbi:RDD family protein [Neorickettsia helminthoeca str. Oregon]|uniref:RDD family protein n=1 Tax=Neorickettsia helminthoeca str. Oregon TaxID=1286528 RepID=X5GWP8_9RICK|nr:RDD family protein [Neorickettsia helminthoeca]AHX11462.1 RDD family protein [Neorickettsia helminthoeca str. Oregon]
MDNIFTYLCGFIKKIFDFPHKVFSFPHKYKSDDRGVLYASQFKRSISILTDLLFCILFLKCSGYVLSSFVDISFPMEVIERYRFALPVSPLDNELMANFYKKMLFIQVIQLLLLVSLVITSWHRFGCTPGKWILRLRVLDDVTLGRPSLSACVKRAVMFPISVGCLFLGIFWIIFDKKGRAWHDVVAGTVVVLNTSPIFKKN